MFAAVNKRNTFIFANQINTDKKDSYYCPGCGEMVFLKKGNEKIPHFSHYAHSKCRTFSEGETQEHLNGKKLIYDALTGRSEKVSIEPYLPKLMQRPDLLWENKKGEKIAVEFQCSSLSFKRMIERTEGYLREGYKVIWAAGRNFHFKKQFTAFQKLMMGEDAAGSTFFVQVSVDKKELQILKDIHLAPTGQTVFEKETISLLQKEAKKLIQSPNIFASSSVNYNLRHRQLEQALFYKNKSFSALFQLMYEQNESVVSLPAETYRTVKTEWLLKNNSFEWKYRMVLWTEEFSINSVITLSKLLSWLERHLKKKTIQLHNMPLLSPEARIKPFVQFLDLLTKEGVLKKTAKNKWTVKSRAKRFNYLEEKKSYLA